MLTLTFCITVCPITYFAGYHQRTVTILFCFRHMFYYNVLSAKVQRVSSFLCIWVIVYSIIEIIYFTVKRFLYFHWTYISRSLLRMDEKGTAIPYFFRYKNTDIIPHKVILCLYFQLHSHIFLRPMSDDIIYICYLLITK